MSKDTKLMNELSITIQVLRLASGVHTLTLTTSNIGDAQLVWWKWGVPSTVVSFRKSPTALASGPGRLQVQARAISYCSD